MYLSNQTSAGNTPLYTNQTLLLYDKERQENVDLRILIEHLSDKDDSREIIKKRIIQLAHQSEKQEYSSF